MKVVGVTVLLSILLCGCSRETEQANTRHSPPDPTNEVKLLLASLEGRPIWYSKEGTSSAASNRLVQLKHIAVPMLLDKLSSLDYRDDAAVEKLGLGCAILSTNAYPVLKEVAKGVVGIGKFGSDIEFNKTSGSLGILQNAGPRSFGPVVDVVEEEIASNSFESGQRRWYLKQHAMYLAEDVSAQCVEELLRLYQVRNDSRVLREYISMVVREVLYCEDFESLVPVVKSLLQSNDDFLVTEGLAFLQRCKRLTSGEAPTSG